MRFMVLVKASKDSEAGAMPPESLLGAMAKYNEELVKAGILLDGAGLKPSSQGVRVKFSGGNRTVVQGPFSATGELVSGYWIINVKSKDEAIEWAKRIPFDPEHGAPEAEVEIRPFFELEDFQPSEALDHHKALAEELASRKKS
ncbi:MAG TPA: YciI family protein [Prosthecobacter sp.]|nr:YciI family protein [Prosthecobacter sp.]